MRSGDKWSVGSRSTQGYATTSGGAGGSGSGSGSGGSVSAGSAGAANPAAFPGPVPKCLWSRHSPGTAVVLVLVYVHHLLPGAREGCRDYRLG